MTQTTKVSLRGLYKIFGHDDKSVLPHVKDGMGKEELLTTHKHVLGLQDINVEMQAGEITVVMGLSGSGKSTLIRHLNRLIEPTDGEILVAVWFSTRSLSVLLFNAFCLSFFAFVDHFEPAMQTFAVILVCTIISALFGIPIGIAMSKYNRLQKAIIPVLDLLQTLPTFVYLIPLIFLFPIGESRLYGIAIILYAIVPVIRLTDLGVRLVDKDVVEAGNAFGMSPGQKLTKVELPLALPNIMAGLNQTIMMSLAMVVIASMVTAPGLGVLVLRGIRNLELGVGLMAGVCIVLLAVMLDRTSKAALSRIDRTKNEM